MADYASDEDVLAGTALLSPLFLRFYDPIVWTFGGWFWGCSLKRLVSFTEQHLSARHLDIGVGNGRLLSDSRFPVSNPELTLLDLSPNSLRFAGRKLSRYRPRLVRGDCLEPFDLPAESVDSVSLVHMMHCLPGTIADKAVVFDHALKVLTPGGVVFGCIILWGEVDHRPLARLMIPQYNRRRYMTNLNDDVAGLEQALSTRFATFEVEVAGSVGLFVARAAAVVKDRPGSPVLSAHE